MLRLPFVLGVIPWADNHGANGSLGIVTELVLGGPGWA